MPLIVGIAGGTGSGKTTVARAVAGAFLDRAVVIEQDCFYIDRGNVPFKDRRELNFDHPDSIDVGAMVEVLTVLKLDFETLKLRIHGYQGFEGNLNRRTTTFSLFRITE